MENQGGRTTQFVIDTEGSTLLQRAYQMPDAAPDIVNVVLQFSISAGASDILFEPQIDKGLVRVRIDGILHALTHIPKEHFAPVIARLKVMAGLDMTVNKTAQEGKMDYQYEQRTVDMRMAVAEVANGQFIALRVHDSSSAIFNLDVLGLQEPNLSEYLTMLRSTSGMILTCGPTGSGKTSTLYSSLQLVNTGLTNIISIEDPIEYLLPGVNQMQVDNEHGMTFAEGLRVILRLNPNIIFVGEIRDEETAHIALESALTGHLVLSSLHANGALPAVFRLIDLGIEKFFLNSALQGVVSQRLIRKVCATCAQEVAVSEQEQAYYTHITGRTLATQMQGAGCHECSMTGYKGRIGIYEVLAMNDEMRSAISRGDNEHEMTELLKQKGYITLAQDGMSKVDQRITNIKEVMSHVYNAL